jgi:hypothetical protein
LALLTSIPPGVGAERQQNGHDNHDALDEDT